MLFQRGDKFHIAAAEMFIEVETSYPGSQGIHIQREQENHYGVWVNGKKWLVPESSLVDIIKSDMKLPEVGETEPEVEAPAIEYPKVEEKPIEQIIEEKKVKPDDVKKKGWFKKLLRK
jgi:hypothetical protein